MAFTTYPLNSVDYSAEDAELFHCTRSSGIYAGDDFQISVTGADRSITIGPGLGWIRNSKFSGKVVAQKESATLELGLSDATYPRIDAVAIRFSAADNRTTLVVKQGAAAPTPRSPVPERTEAVHELHLCNVRRPAGSTVVTAADVVDLRMDTYYCGLMADSVTQVDTAAIEAQVKGLTKRLDSTISAVQAGAGFVAKTRIWRNEGVSSVPIEDFSINVDRSGYDGIEILYLENASGSKILSTGYIPSFSSVATLDAGDLYTHLRRAVDLSEDGVISFSRCQLQTTIDRFEPGTWLIPVEVYGITGIIDPNAEVPPSEPKDELAVHPVTLADYEDAGGLDGFVDPGIYVMYLEGKMLEDYPDLFVAPDGSSAQRAELTVGLTENGALYQTMTVYFPVTVDGASTYRTMTAHRLLWGDPPMHSWRVARGDLKKETEVRRIFGSAAYEAVGGLDGLTDPGIYVLYVDDSMAADMPELWLSPDGIRAERAELMVSNTIDSELYQSMTVYFPVTVDGASTYRTMTAHRLLWGDPPGRKWKIGRGDLKAEPDEAAALEDLAEAGVVDPVADGNNGVFVDENDRVYTF